MSIKILYLYRNRSIFLVVRIGKLAKSFYLRQWFVEKTTTQPLVWNRQIFVRYRRQGNVTIGHNWSSQCWLN